MRYPAATRTTRSRARVTGSHDTYTTRGAPMVTNMRATRSPRPLRGGSTTARAGLYAGWGRTAALLARLVLWLPDKYSSIVARTASPFELRLYARSAVDVCDDSTETM